MEFRRFLQRTNVLLVIDHAGRAGNGFFQTIFDQHHQVLACPWMHYIYSYLITQFEEQDCMDSSQVHEHWKNTPYFSLLYHDLDDQRSAFIRKIGGDPKAELDRNALRNSFDQILLSETTINRRELVAAIFYSFAVGLGRDLAQIRYLLCPDSISLRTESVMNGFSGRIIDVVLADYPNAKLIHLERDPRAGLASSNHQFVNQLGNMYGLKWGQYFQRLRRLHQRDFDWDSVFVFGFWLIYFRQTYKAIERKRRQHSNRFITVRNEDINLKFMPTMRNLVDVLNVDFLEIWDDDFQPTMLGKLWTGTGAYNSQYQTHRHGPLSNDTESAARVARGPNAYVTQRWRLRMKKNEVLLVEYLLASEIKHFGYEFLYWKGEQVSSKKFIIALWQPLRGELPTPKWIVRGLKVDAKDFFNRVFYLFTFPVYYIYARIVLLNVINKSRIFKLDAGDSE